MTLGRRLASTLTGTLASLVGLVALSSALGGPLTWVVTEGGSMQPGISAGTLAVLQARPEYAVGDVVGYRNADLAGQVVLHRVVAVDGERLVLRGDANSWTDPVRPGPRDVLGEALFTVPRLGAALHTLRGPVPIALVGGGLTLLVLRSGRSRRRTGTPVLRRRTPAPTSVPRAWAPPAPAAQEPLPDAPETHPPHGPRSWQATPRPRLAPEPRVLDLSGGVRETAAVGLVVCVLVGSATAVLPTAQTTREDRPVQASVAFGYDADAPRGIVYPSGRVETGTPVFTRVVDAVTVRAELSLVVPEGAAVQGTWHLELDVADATGWGTTAYIGQPVPLAEAGRQLRLDVPRLRALAESATAATGLDPAARTVTVRAVVDALASRGAQSADLDLAPALLFDLQDDVLRLAEDAALTGGADAALPPLAAPAGARLQVGPLALPVDPLRWLAGAGGALCLVLLLLAGIPAPWRDETARVRRRHPGLLVPTGPVPLADPVVDVEDLAALVRIAERYDRFVLTHDGPQGEVFLVQDDGTTYRFATAPRRSAVALPRPRTAEEAAAPVRA